MDKGSIRIELETGVEEHLLIIADDGVGLPEDFDLGKTDSFGLNLVSNLVNQLDGNISFDRVMEPGIILPSKSWVTSKDFK